MMIPFTPRPEAAGPTRKPRKNLSTKAPVIACLFSAALSNSRGSMIPESTVAATAPAMRLKPQIVIRLLCRPGIHHGFDDPTAVGGRIFESRCCLVKPNMICH